MCVLFAEVNLHVMGLSRMSLMMPLLRRGGAPPRCLCNRDALMNQLLSPMWMGSVVRTLLEASNDTMSCGLMTSIENGMRMAVPGDPWSEMIREWLRGWFGSWDGSIVVKMI